ARLDCARAAFGSARAHSRRADRRPRRAGLRLAAPSRAGRPRGRPRDPLHHPLSGRGRAALRPHRSHPSRAPAERTQPAGAARGNRSGEPRARVPGPGLDPGRPAPMIRPRIVRAMVEKELRETLRDRRTLIVMILLPLTLYPLLTLIFASVAVAQRQKETDRPSTVCLDGGSRALSDALGAEQKVAVTGRGGCSVEDIRPPSPQA